MASRRRDKPEVKASEAGNLYVDLNDVLQSKSGRQTIRDMSKLSKRSKRASGRSKSDRSFPKDQTD